MSNINAQRIHIGISPIATNNFTAYQPSTPDGTIRIAVGNPGTTSDVVFISNAGRVGIGGAPSGAQALQVTGAATFSSSVTASSFVGPLTGNASTATSASTLTTSRLINGTSFNGASDIVTANWGNSISLTVGSTSKTINGSGNVSFNASEIGFVPITGGTFSGSVTMPNLTVTGSITGTVSDATNATRLANARTINGTSFNGTADITTSNWGTSRNITIGSTTKSVNGSTSYSWSSSDIGISNGTLTLTATGSGVTAATTTFSANQSTNANFTVNVPGTNLAVTGGTTTGPTITSSTGTNATLPAATSSASGVVTTGTQTFGGSKTFANNVTFNSAVSLGESKVTPTNTTFFKSGITAATIIRGYFGTVTSGNPTVVYASSGASISVSRTSTGFYRIIHNLGHVVIPSFTVLHTSARYVYIDSITTDSVYFKVYTGSAVSDTGTVYFIFISE